MSSFDPLGQVVTLFGDYGILLVAAIIVFVVLGAVKAAAKHGGERWGAYGIFGLTAVAGFGLIWFTGSGFGWFLFGIGILLLFVVWAGSGRKHG